MRLFPIINRFRFGYCPICKKSTIFLSLHDWLRDHYHCLRCKSIPRFRALIDVLEYHFPNWRDLIIHESSPCGAASDMLAREGGNYSATHYFPDVPPGSSKWGYQCENLESQTFDDGCFNLVITQDVFEHILHPDKAFREIARTLRPGGAHVFTIPWYSWKKTLVRARQKEGEIEYLLPAEYHGNPINENGSLVVTEWGNDMLDFIHQCSGMSTEVIQTTNPRKGIEAKFLEVFISRKQN